MHRVPRLLALSFSLLGVKAAAEEVTPSDIYGAHRGAVVGIQCGILFGTGFLFQSTRHVATAEHVIACGRNPVVKFADGTEVAGKVLLANPRR
jgi:hypothetical protein